MTSLLNNINSIALIILVASLFAILSSRLNQLPMIGYVVAGILVGPHVLALIPEEYEVHFLAELGVILLSFVLGIELSLEAFRKSYRAAIPVALLLVLGTLGLTTGASLFFGWSVDEALVYAFVTSLSSTAVGVRLLKQSGLIEQRAGEVALSVLIAQDLIFVPMIIVTNALGGESGLGGIFLIQMLIAGGVTFSLIWFLSSRPRVHLPFEKWVERHDELIPVAALAWCFVGASLSQVLGLSPAFGAFLGGLVIGNSHSKEKIFPKIEPMQSVLLMVFFVSVGMLIDLKVVWESLGSVLFLVFAAMLFKTFLCMLLLRLFISDSSWSISYATALAISQIGEFSFVLSSTAASLTIISTHSYQLLVAVIAISLSVSPLWLLLMAYFYKAMRSSEYQNRNPKNCRAIKRSSG